MIYEYRHNLLHNLCASAPVFMGPPRHGKREGTPITFQSFYFGAILVPKFGKLFTDPTYNLLSNLVVISDIHRSFIPNKITFTKYCLTE